MTGKVECMLVPYVSQQVRGNFVLIKLKSSSVESIYLSIDIEFALLCIDRTPEILFIDVRNACSHLSLWRLNQTPLFEYLIISLPITLMFGEY